MLRLAGQLGATTMNNGSGHSSATMLFHLSPNNVADGLNSCIFHQISGDGHKIYIYNSYLYIHNAAAHGDDPGVWSCPISTQEQLVAISHVWGDDSSNPVVYINGAAVTVSETDTPSGSISLSSSYPYTIGCYSDRTNTFQGRVSEFALWNTAFTASELEQITKSRVKRFPLNFKTANLVHYYPLDELYDGGSLPATTQSITPNEDIANTWSGTYANIVNNDTSYLEADGRDDGKVHTCGFSTFTIPSGKSVSHLKITIVHDCEGSATGGSWGLYDNAGVLIALGLLDNTTKTTDILYTDFVLTQAQLDGMYVSFNAPSSISKDDYVRVYYFNIVAYYMGEFKDLKSGNNLNAVAVGAAPDLFLSHGG